MSWRVDKYKEEWSNFVAAWWDTRRGWSHDYVDFFVELNRYMPYTKGHVEAFAAPAVLLWAVLT